MMRLRERFQSSYQNEASEIQEIYNDISRILGIQVSSQEKVLAQVNIALRKNNLPPLSSFDDIDTHASEMLKSVKITTEVDRIRSLQKILWNFKKINLLSKREIDEIEKTNIILNEFIKSGLTRDIQYLSFLEKGEEILTQREMNECPLCEQSIDNEKLRFRLKSRIKTLHELSGKASEMREMLSVQYNRLHNIFGRINEIIISIDKFPEFSEYKIKLRKQKEELRIYRDDLNNALDINEISRQSLIREWNKNTNTIIKKYDKTIRQIIKKDSDR